MELGVAEFCYLTLRFGFAPGRSGALLEQPHLAGKVALFEIVNDHFASGFILDDYHARSCSDVVCGVALLDRDDGGAVEATPTICNCQELVDFLTFGRLQIEAYRDGLQIVDAWSSGMSIARMALATPF